VQISRPDEETVLLSQLDQMLAELLRRVVRSADPSGSEAARNRLFSAPTEDTGEAEFAEDWRNYVEPELRQLFQSSLEVIEGDVKALRLNRKAGEATLVIPVNHLESWIHGLNQARLALTARHDFDEKDMDRVVPLIGDERSFALLQVRFYGILQELFLRELEND
jgi:hypothetical protein